MSPQSSRVHLLCALGAAGFREAVPGGAAIGPTPGAAVQGSSAWSLASDSDERHRPSVHVTCPASVSSSI